MLTRSGSLTAHRCWSMVFAIWLGSACDGATPTRRVEIPDALDASNPGPRDDAAVGVADAGPDCLDGETRDCANVDCPEGRDICERGRWSGCTGPDELCNGRDDDCDGEIDEDFQRLGETCTVGVGGCARDGARACGPDGDRIICDVAAGAPEAEICDGIDNDCDGTTDEGIAAEPLAQSCFTGPEGAMGVGECAPGVRVCRSGEFGNCIGEHLPRVEVCDGLDNNCDGTADEGNPGGGQQCPTGLHGACAIGVRVCEGGAFLCSAPRGEEVCDDEDNDCDGRVDEDEDGEGLSRPCFSGPDETRGIGRCRDGVELCTAGQWGACLGEVLPGAEICDGADNNCNGESDDIDGPGTGGGRCACEPGTTRACYTGPAGTLGRGVCSAGEQVCDRDGAGYGPCGGEVIPDGEICDGRDDDCDGVVDDAPGTGAPCGLGVGACFRQGALECDETLGILVCAAEIAAAADELCNGIDDDCDGIVDDVPGLGALCEVGIGTCRRFGNFVCAPGRLELSCTVEPGLPENEICDALDNDCDGEVDETSPGFGQPCFRGLGACRERGALSCTDGAEQCDAIPGAPVFETCNGEDDDCDAEIDEEPVDAGRFCTVGEGTCERAGRTICGDDGRLGCDVDPGMPRVERCDGVDDDCDGEIDEGIACERFESCLDALVRGFDEDGVYPILRDGSDEPVLVWCDQTTDGGGWTLVGSTRDTTLNDEASEYYDDLSTLAPTSGHEGIWSGLRTVGERFDTRFACRDTVGAASDPMTVDLTFYGVRWYREFTRGVDAESCFSELEGRGRDVPEPPRRDNVSGEVLGPGAPWIGGVPDDADRFLEGEDACGAADDFTVDFADRGMGGLPSDGTDWGEADGVAKCGAPVDGGQWFIYVRERDRGRIGVIGLSSVARTLRDEGVSADALEYDDPALPMSLFRYDAIFIGRYTVDWRRMTPNLAVALDDFNRAGGNVVTEQDGLAIFTSGYDPTFVHGLGAPEPLGWFSALVGGGQQRGLDTEITLVLPDDPAFRGVSNPFAGGGATQFFFTIQPVDELTPTHLETLATFAGDGTASFPAGGLPAIARGRRCDGNVLFVDFDYRDDPDHLGLGPLVLNLARAAVLPPPARIPDVCPLGDRMSLHVCGTVERDPRELFRGTFDLQVVEDCRPDAATQALIVTSDGVDELDGDDLRRYLDDGGSVITAGGSSAAVYALAFPEAGGAAGALAGNCRGNVAPVVRFNAGDRFWVDNDFEAEDPGRTGCGFDLSALPAVEPLGGWDPVTVSLGYRDRGRGRLWLVEADWTLDRPIRNTSRGLLHYMITHASDGLTRGGLSFAGVRNDLAVRTVERGGFRRCWHGDYIDATPLDDIRDACDGNVLLMGCHPAGDEVLTVAAMGRRGDVFTEVADAAVGLHEHNGVAWYFNESRSWGFGPGGAEVNRVPCDTRGEQGSERLCWHTLDGDVVAGWRCGLETGIGVDFERVIYERDGGL